MNYEELKKQVAIDLELTPDTVEQKSLKLSSIYIRYLDTYMAELRKLKDIQLVKDKNYTQLLHKFRKDGYEGFEVRGKEIEHYICLNQEYQKIGAQYKDQEFIVSYLEKVLDQINKISFNIKNFIEVNKIKMGMG